VSGFGGFVSNTALASAGEICDKMQDALKERGAEHSGTYISEKLCLIHSGYIEETRQPLRSVFGRTACIIAFDGELYNRAELRQELNALGHRADDNDAAIAMHGYMAWGKTCVEHFNGAFAFALWDENGLFLVRDRLGQKPLYYSTTKNGLVFASNIKAVLAHPSVDPTIGEEGIMELVMLGPGRSPGCAIFQNIKELAPAEWAYFSLTSNFEIGTYWRLKAKIHQDSYDQTVETVRHLITDATRRQLSPGAPMGLLLSGGLDSSILAAVSGVKNTFDLDFIGNATHSKSEQDQSFVDTMQAYLNLNHQRVILGSDELAEALIPAMEARGLPGMADVDASLLLFLQRVGAKYNCALSGEGADEIFGGYPWCHKDEIATFPWSDCAELRYSFLTDNFTISPKEYLETRFKRAFNSANVLYDDSDREKLSRQMFNLNLGWFLQTLLARSDAMSSAAKIKLRMPFLDYRLVEYMYNVPWEYKTRDGTKGILRMAFKHLLPEAIVERKKVPFPKTHNPGYTKLMQDMFCVMLEEDSPIFGVVCKKSLKNFLTNDSPINWYGQLMSYPQVLAYFLQINAWIKAYNVRNL